MPASLHHRLDLPSTSSSPCHPCPCPLPLPPSPSISHCLSSSSCPLESSGTITRFGCRDSHSSFIFPFKAPPPPSLFPASPLFRQSLFDLTSILAHAHSRTSTTASSHTAHRLWPSFHVTCVYTQSFLPLRPPPLASNYRLAFLLTSTSLHFHPDSGRARLHDPAFWVALISWHCHRPTSWPTSWLLRRHPCLQSKTALPPAPPLFHQCPRPDMLPLAGLPEKAHLYVSSPVPPRPASVRD